MIQSLDVMLRGKKVGTLTATRKGYKEQICFYFDPEFVKNGSDIAPLRAPLSGIAARKGLPIYPEEDKLFGGLPSFIADSLPDRWGNILFNEWAKAHGIRQKDLNALDRLAYIGRRGMGALEFVPSADESLESPFRVEIEQLSQLACTAMAEAGKFHTQLTPDLAIESLFKVGTSAGGRHPKAVINLNPETGECYSGQVAAPLPGFVPMIIKFDEHGDVPSTRIEYSYYLMATDAGLPMMPSRLTDTASGTHFLTERFDRRDGEKVQVQTLAAMSPTASSYEELFEAARRLEILHSEMQMLFNQMVMNILAANIDDHNKNFSFILEDDGNWHVAPTYDFTFAVDPSAPFYINRHCLTINGKDQEIGKADVLALASRFNVKEANCIINRAISAVRDYRKHAARAGVSEEWILKIETEIADRINAFLA